MSSKVKQILASVWAKIRQRVKTWILPVCILGLAYTSASLIKNNEERKMGERLDEQRRVLTVQYNAQLANVETLQIQRMNERDARMTEQLARIEEQHEMILDLRRAIGEVQIKQQIQIKAHGAELKTLQRTEAAAQKAAAGVSDKDKEDINKAITGDKK